MAEPVGDEKTTNSLAREMLGACLSKFTLDVNSHDWTEAAKDTECFRSVGLLPIFDFNLISACRTAKILV